MSITDNEDGKKVVTTTLREMVSLVASIVGLVLGVLSIGGVIGSWAVANYRLGAVELRAEATHSALASAEAQDAARNAEVLVIKSQLTDIKDQNRRILEKINQL